MSVVTLTNYKGAYTLIIGFDSAWSGKYKGGICGLLLSAKAQPIFLEPENADFDDADRLINKWSMEYKPERVLIMLDQPHIVNNETGCRPVEKVLRHLVLRSKGGVQPSALYKTNSSSKKLELNKMFGNGSPLWNFIEKFPHHNKDSVRFRNSASGTWIVETYPVMTIIGLLLPSLAKLPKYNPKPQSKFSIEDFKKLSLVLSEHFQIVGLVGPSKCSRNLHDLQKVSKMNQDILDSLICLLAGYYLAACPDMSLVVGDVVNGSITFPCLEKCKAEIGIDTDNKKYNYNIQITRV